MSLRLLILSDSYRVKNHFLALPKTLREMTYKEYNVDKIDKMLIGERNKTIKEYIVNSSNYAEHRGIRWGFYPT